MLSRPGDTHTMEKTGTTPLYMWNMVIAPRLWKQLIPQILTPEESHLLTRHKASPLARLPEEKLVAIEQTVIRLKNLKGKRLLFTHLLTDLLMHLLDRGLPPQPSRLPAALKNALASLDSPDSLREGLSAMTRAANYSREHPSRELKRLSGKSPTDWILEKRLARACELLMSSDEKIIDVAYDTAFNHLGYFTRTFTRFKGLPPRKWREQKRQESMVTQDYIPRK